VWIKRTQVYRSLLKCHEGQIRNRGNLKRLARGCGIVDTMSILQEEINTRLNVCIKQCNHFCKHKMSYRRKHLQRGLAVAREKEDDEAERQILSIIQQEKDKSFWRRINYVLGKPRGGSCFKVQVEQEDGTVKEHLSQEDLQKAIWTNIHRKRFYLAEEAPLCSGPLRGQFGYNAITPTARAILAGTYQYPPEYDKATKEILKECAKICLLIPKDLVTTRITKDDWHGHWNTAKESTSASASGWHFGHYKAGLRSEYITYLHALQATLITRQGIVLDRWSKGLSVMLEKIFGCLLIT
jgi:hypothetical protein